MRASFLLRGNLRSGRMERTPFFPLQRYFRRNTWLGGGGGGGGEGKKMEMEM